MFKYCLCILCALFLLLQKSQSQDQRTIDSLQSILKTQRGTERFPILYELVFQFIEKDNRQALFLIEELHRNKQGLW